MPGITKFSAAIADQIVHYMEAGAGFGRACEMAGISRMTGYRWRKAGNESRRGIKADFDARIAAIEAGHVAAAEQTVKRIMRDKRDNVAALNAAKFYLERRVPEEYGRRDHVTHEVRQTMVVELMDHLQQHLDEPTYGRVIAALASGGSEETQTG